MTDGNFLKLITTSNEDKIRGFIDSVFYDYASRHKKVVGFGSEGCIEFTASLFLGMHDPSTAKPICEAIENVFKGKFTPLDFSNQMDNVVAKSSIQYETWSSAFRYLKANHQWITSHPCGALGYIDL